MTEVDELSVISDVNNAGTNKHYILSKKTFSQCGEDKVVQFLLDLTYIKDGFTYLDIGANHPINGSNTMIFYQMGYRGVVIEPNAALAADFEKYRPEDILLNVGVGLNDNKTAQNFYVFEDHQLSTFSREKSEKLVNMGQNLLRIEQVPLCNINDVIFKYLNGKVTLISIDTEGLDFDILRSLDFERYKPEVLIVENSDVDTSLPIEVKMRLAKERNRSQKIANFLEEKGYFHYANNFVNSVFITEELLKNFLEIVK